MFTKKILLTTILCLFFILSKSQTCTSPVIVPVNSGFRGIDSFANSSTRFLKFTADNYRTRIKLYIKNYNPALNVINLYNNNCANLAANKLNKSGLDPRMDGFPYRVFGDSIEIVSTGFINGNQYLIEIGISPSNPSTYTKYNISIVTSPASIGCTTGGCPSYTCEMVCNGSFENITAGVTNYGQIFQANGWFSPTVGTPDLYSSTANSAWPDCGVPCNVDGTRSHISTTCTSQNNYALLLNTFIPPSLGNYQYSEYIETQLKSPMVWNQSYIISFYVSKAQNGNATLKKLSYWLTPNTINLNTMSPIPSTLTPAGTLSNITVLNSYGWTKVSFCYTAVGGEQFLTIGMPDDPNAFSVSTNSAVNVANCASFMWPPNPGYTQSNNHSLYIDEVSVKAFLANAGPNQTVTPCGNVTLNGTTSTCGTVSLGAMNYNWTGPGLNTSSPTTVVPVSTTSTYWFQAYTTADDGSTCSNISSMTVISNTPVPLVITPSSTIVCPGSNVTLTASGGVGTYTWLPGGSTSNPAVFTVNSPSTYTVSGKTSTGCTISQTIAISTYTNVLSVTSSTTSICSGNTATLTASGGNTYTWSPGGQTTSTVSVSPGSTTTYTVTGLTNPNNCLRSATKTITVNSLPTLTISPSATNTICLNSSKTLTASGASTYTWQAGGIVSPTVTLSPTVSTTYTVTGTSAVGCTNTKTVSIVVNPLPSISCSTNKTLVCQGSTSTLSASGASTYTWSPVGLTGASVVVTSTANPTNYTVTGTSALGCTNTCVVTQSVFTSSTSFFTITASPSSTICNSGGTTTLTATGSPNAYTWTPGSLIQNTLVISSAGVYTATSTNSIGCVGSKTFEVFGTDDVAAINPIPPVCGIQPINLALYAYPSGTGTYSVNGTQISGSTYTFSSASSTAYTVGFTYTGGVLCNYTATYALTTNTACCTSSLTQITSSVITSSVTISGGKVLNQNITISSGGDLTFTGGEFLIAPNVQITVQGGGTFRMEGAHLYACQNQMWNGVTVQYNGRAISIPNGTVSTFIEDAKTAINVEPITSPPPTFAAPIEVHNTIFNKNYVAIQINTVTLSYDLDVEIQENVFTCRTLTFTSSSWPNTSTVSPGLRAATNPTTGLTVPYTLQSATYTTCLSPYSGLPSKVGVALADVSYSLNYSNGVQIGEANNQVPSYDDYMFNLFDALGYGVYADNSNVSVINNVFQNTRQYVIYTPRPKTYGGTAIHYYVSSDYFRKLNLTNTISSYSLTPSVGNRFWDCHRAVDATNAYILNMEYATVRSTQNTSGGTGFLAGNTGVVSTTNRFSYNFRNNEFTNIRNPINIPIVANTYNYTGTPTVGIYANNFAILNNYFGPVTTTTASTSGQYINNAITISSPNSGNWNKVTFTGLSVMNNQINRVYRGISINGMDSYSTAVSNNTISMVDDGLFNSTQRGIELVNTQNSVVITTNTLSAANTTNTLATLVYLGNNIGTTSPSVTCNNLSSSYQGFEFNNDNRNTFWRGNLMQTHARGMVISNSGTIGVQGSSGAPIDNQWNGTWTGNNHTYVDNTSDAQYSKLWVQAGGVYQPTLNAGPVFQYYGASGNINTTTGAFSCGGGGGGGGSGRYTSGAPRVYEVTNNYDQSSYKSGGGTDSIDTDEEYVAVNNSYRILEANPDLISNSPSNAAFYNNYANTSIGKFAQAEKQAYNGANTQANATSSSVSSKVSVEDNYKTYFALYDKYKSGNLDETDLASLNSLANLCPGIDGPVIYQARALYQVVTKDVIVFKENCEQISNARQSKKSSITPSVANWDVQLYPNPTSGELNIVSKNNSEQLTVIIKDATGKIVNQNNLQVSDFISNLTLNLENGLYLITITNNKNETTTKKLVIAK